MGEDGRGCSGLMPGEQGLGGRERMGLLLGGDGDGWGNQVRVTEPEMGVAKRMVSSWGER